MTIYQIDATNQALGRIATQVAHALRGKHLPSYAPEKMANVEVVISNLKAAKFTGNKLDQKTYFHYSGYHGGIRARNLGDEWEKDPQEVLRHIVYRMLPKNKTRDKIILNLKFN
ncbi:MAG: 50S ribosomal protein L13 [Candidatus Pacebacteria bacterium]|nr:50S ribosomal protein L13 [Candidatus Paceibacterota bacterium]